MKEIAYLGELGVDGIMILRYVLKNYDGKPQTRLIWLRTAISDGLL